MEPLSRDSLRLAHVEDDDEFARLSELCLASAGFKQPIVRCTDGERALHYLSTVKPESAPHVILLDLNLPRLNGLEVLHWLRHSYSEREVAVYLLTSSDTPEDLRQATTAGATQYLVKNPLFHKLIQHLDNQIVLHNRQAGDALPPPHANGTTAFNQPQRTGIIQTKRLTISFSRDRPESAWKL